MQNVDISRQDDQWLDDYWLDDILRAKHPALQLLCLALSLFPPQLQKSTIFFFIIF